MKEWYCPECKRVIRDDQAVPECVVEERRGTIDSSREAEYELRCPYCDDVLEVYEHQKLEEEDV